VRAVFADSGYWIALLNPRDSLHETAKMVSGSLGPIRLVTSEMVLTECLNDLGKRGESLRRAAVALVEELRRAPTVSIEPQSSLQFQEALLLYAMRSDKAWGHTDCSSFRIMDRHGLTEALTHDRHFAQAGFRPLLRSQTPPLS
jgi:predicted nucleic acid-binding protein